MVLQYFICKYKHQMAVCGRVCVLLYDVVSNLDDLWGNPLPGWLKVITTLTHTTCMKVKLAITPSLWLLPKPLYQRLEE